MKKSMSNYDKESVQITWAIPPLPRKGGFIGPGAQPKILSDRVPPLFKSNPTASMKGRLNPTCANIVFYTISPLRLVPSSTVAYLTWRKTNGAGGSSTFPSKLQGQRNWNHKLTQVYAQNNGSNWFPRQSFNAHLRD